MMQFLLLLIITFVFSIFAPSISAKGMKQNEGAMKACQAKEASLKQKSEQLSKMADNMIKKFDAIAGRVQAYYTSKAVPNGKTVSNYDTLIADVQAKKSAAETALTAATSSISDFDCSGDNPKQQLIQYRDNMRTVKDALKNYRTSIKNLIVAVRTVTGEEANGK